MKRIWVLKNQVTRKEIDSDTNKLRLINRHNNTMKLRDKLRLKHNDIVQNMFGQGECILLEKEVPKDVKRNNKFLRGK